MTYIVGGMAIFFIASFTFPLGYYVFTFDFVAIMQGEFWRVLTFIFLPPNMSMIFIIFALYFYWLIGTALEREWGAFKFNVFYLCGMIGTIIAGLITGFATNFYLNLSLFLAFAILFPNFEIMIFFILPVKIKWLAYLNIAFLLFMLFFDSWPGRVALLVSISNVVLFFGKDFIDRIKQYHRKAQWQRKARKR